MPLEAHEPLPHSHSIPLRGTVTRLIRARINPRQSNSPVMNASPLPRLTFVLGGARSGKSRYAEGLVMDCAPPWVYIATAQAHDDEWAVQTANTGSDAMAGGAPSKHRSICPAQSQPTEVKDPC